MFWKEINSDLERRGTNEYGNAGGLRYDLSCNTERNS